MKSFKKLGFSFAALGLLALASPLLSSTAIAQTDEEKGLEIATEWDKRDHGFGDSQATMQMVLVNRHGEESKREMRQKVLEVPGLDIGDKSLTIFDKPRDVKGTAFLSFAKILDPDDQWLYLPALKRVKRISSKNKSGPFVGSEFAFEDLSANELKKYTYKYLRDEKCGDLECFVVEQYPTYENSGYTKTIVWYDKDEYRQQKTEFYDRKKTLLKTLVYSDFKQYLGKHWRAHKMDMENHQTGKKTHLVFTEFEFQTGLKDGDFNKNSLKRAR
ncbi:outer membrane lipoprotein-sorting protein [Curvivirga aplysinae]|uniref:outer membrane lipoprotein-sorting protein n=1 Tax=Curvivirga aplysinae TaxID=2529852 RepID=UPI001C3FA3C0|nr:outer membrane lipoprotein-sorting protein [Curvivirga aplysinae]